jgi:hypothetical protein
MGWQAGNCGRGAINYGDELAVLRGCLASEDDEKFYPSNHPESGDAAWVAQLREYHQDKSEAA